MTWRARRITVSPPLSGVSASCSTTSAFRIGQSFSNFRILNRRFKGCELRRNLRAVQPWSKNISDLKFNSGIPPHKSESGSKYTVPAIQHVPTNTYIMDSTPIAQFLESTYPDPPLPLTSDLGREIELKSRSVVGMAFRNFVMPREIDILSPPAQEYFRRTREAALGHKLEDLLDPGNEEQVWRSLGDSMEVISDLMQTNEANGPFILGADPTYTDFFIAGALQSARIVNEDVFQRIAKYPGYEKVYEACLPYMARKD